ncbi:MAG: DNA-protecting protein DprA [Ponticaulis sp.]|nr:DNA-protecting protein DprA [Ponticaulis sp.]
MSATSEQLACLRLARTPGIGPLTFSRLLKAYGSGHEALENLPGRLRSVGRSSVRIYPEKDAETEFRYTEKIGARILFSSDGDFPRLLKALDPAPPVITILGDLSVSQKPCISMVGARNASAAAMKLARNLAFELGERGYTVVSGLARGVDTAAHHGALSTGTIAVIAGGIDNIYPHQNTDLRNQIAEQGLIVSESRFGHEPRAADFPRRNRLITGLSMGVIVVEAAKRSGSLISARCALEQGREVMAIPGSPLDPRTKGSNGLIKSGATLVETADDVVEVVQPSLPQQHSLFDPSPSDYEDDRTEVESSGEVLARIRSALSPTPTSISDIAQATGLSSRQCSTALVELELAGQAMSISGGLIVSAG